MSLGLPTTWIARYTASCAVNFATPGRRRRARRTIQCPYRTYPHSGCIEGTCWPPPPRVALLITPNWRHSASPAARTAMVSTDVGTNQVRTRCTKPLANFWCTAPKAARCLSLELAGKLTRDIAVSSSASRCFPTSRRLLFGERAAAPTSPERCHFHHLQTIASNVFCWTMESLLKLVIEVWRRRLIPLF